MAAAIHPLGRDRGRSVLRQRICHWKAFQDTVDWAAVTLTLPTLEFHATTPGWE